MQSALHHLVALELRSGSGVASAESNPSLFACTIGRGFELRGSDATHQAARDRLPGIALGIPLQCGFTPQGIGECSGLGRQEASTGTIGHESFR
ncbi:hypothetical protein Y694_03811 [Methylibium sp. T29-B]|nr:hypothetical protein Y694_03811 [Methylibium sp. T29-B]